MNSERSSELMRALEGQDPKILSVLLSEYATRWRHNSQQIWSMGAVFIPLSLSGVIFGLDDPVRTLAVAVFSVLLIWIWFLFSERLRVIIDRNWRAYAAVESALLKLEPPRLEYGLDELVPSQGGLRARKIRLFIPVVITLAWIFAVVLSFLL